MNWPFFGLVCRGHSWLMPCSYGWGWRKFGECACHRLQVEFRQEVSKARLLSHQIFVKKWLWRTQRLLPSLLPPTTPDNSSGWELSEWLHETQSANQYMCINSNHCQVNVYWDRKDESQDVLHKGKFNVWCPCKSLWPKTSRPILVTRFVAQKKQTHFPTF